MEVNALFNLENWNEIAGMASYVFAAIGVGIILFHLIKLMSIKDYKKKYDYINRHEINLLWYSSIFIIISLGILVNTFFDSAGTLWFFVRIFVTAMIGLIIGVVVNNVLKFYYPFYVEKRLKKLRYTPRTSPKTGKPMKLLTEDEEDVYLDEGMQAEENVFSIDYDVWIDEESGYTKIEKYSGHLHALQCPECNYQTFKVVKEEILESPTEMDEGELMKFFHCEYCGYRERKAFRIARLKSVITEENKAVSL